MNVSEKYKPVCLSELEYEYSQIKEYLNLEETFIVNGPKYCGKTTIVKLYLKYLDFDYLYIDDFTVSKEYLIDKLRYKSNSVFSYFYSKKYIIVIDNYDLFDVSSRELILKYSQNNPMIIITHKYLDFKINFVRISKYTLDYLNSLYNVIYFLEMKENCKIIPEFENIIQMFSKLEFELTSSSSLNSSNSSNSSNKLEINKKYEKGKTQTQTQTLTQSNALTNKLEDYEILFDKYTYDYEDIVKEKDFNYKLYILDRFNNYSIFQNNIVYNHKNIDELSNAYENLTVSLEFFDSLSNNQFNFTSGLDYYSILSIIGTTYTLNEFKIVKESLYRKKKIKLNYF